MKVGDLVKLCCNENYGIVVSLRPNYAQVRWCDPKNEKRGWVTDGRCYAKKNLEVISESR